MSILGVIVRTRPADVPATALALQALPGVELAERPEDAAEDGRLVIVIEDTPERAAAAVMAEIATWPQVHNTSLVYEYSGADSPAATRPVEHYADWRSSPAEMADMADIAAVRPTRPKT